MARASPTPQEGSLVVAQPVLGVQYPVQCQGAGEGAQGTSWGLGWVLTSCG